MTFVWNDDGIRIPDVIVAEVANGYAGFKGIALTHFKQVSWRAYATPNGYQVFITDITGRETMWTGPTFNMVLEVAAAVKRH